MKAPSQLRPRPSRTIPAVITAVVLVVLGAIMVWVGISRLAAGAAPTWATDLGTWLSGLRWNTPLALGLAASLTLFGLLLILSAATPGKRSAVAVRSTRPPSETGVREVAMSRRSIARLAAARADLVDGVDSVSTTVTPKAVRLSVTTPTDHTDGVRDAVTREVQERLRESGLDPVPQVTAQVRTYTP